MILCRNPARIRRFVLNAPLSSVIWPLTIRCRLGDYTRADDDQAHSDHFGDRGGWHGGNFTRAGASLSAGPGIHLFPRPQLSARRLSGRLSRRARSSAGFRRAGRRPGPARPRFRGAVAARPHSVAGRSALRPPGRRASGLYRSRRAAGTDHVSGRSALRPSRWTGGDLRRPSSAAADYPDRGNDGALRPPEAIGPPGTVTGAIPQPPIGADGRPMVLSALPPDEQPEAGPAQLPPNLRRQEVNFVTKEPPGTLVVDTPNTYLYYVLGGGSCDPLWRPRRP